MFSSLGAILVGMYILYRLHKPDYERRYNKKLRYRDMFNPKYWKKL